MSDFPANDAYRLRPVPAWRRKLGGASLRAGRIILWGMIQFGLAFAEQVAEVIAPLLFLAGIVWLAVMRILAGMQFEEPQIQHLVERVPGNLTLAGHALTPDRLIRDGLVLMAVVAACRTLSGIIARET